jgi:hypothetical protein
MKLENALSNIDKTNQATMGFDTKKVLNFNISTGFDWREPPLSGVIGHLFPTDDTYHPLLNNSNYEIATNLFSVEGSNLSDMEKEKYKNKIKDVVINAYNVKGMAFIYHSIIILIIFVILFLYFSSTNNNIGKIFSYILASLSAFLMVIGIYKVVLAKGYGYNDWKTFETKFSAHNVSGATSKSILEKFQSEFDKEKYIEIQEKYAKNGMSNNSSLDGTSLLTGAILSKIFCR